MVPGQIANVAGARMDRISHGWLVDQISNERDDIQES